MYSGTFLMPGMCSKNPGSRRVLADVGMQQPMRDARRRCQSCVTSAMIAPGRTQAAYLSQRGRRRARPAAFQEYRSRGCLRAHVLLWVFACWPLWLHANQKKKLSPMWKSRLRPSLPTLASTSNKFRRASQKGLIWHAAFQLADTCFASYGIVSASLPLKAAASQKVQIRNQRHSGTRFTPSSYGPHAVIQDVAPVPQSERKPC